jgi:Protein of unknwon function (DUF3310)
MNNDPVNHPIHYTSLPSGIEVIQITEHLNFCLGNAVKYILRADYKGNDIQDLEKAIWYLKREIDRRSEYGSPGPFSDADEDNPTLPFLAGLV